MQFSHSLPALLVAIIKGHEEFPAGRGKSQRDPAADAINCLLATPVPTKS